jgi:hypothetical protein
MSVYNVTADLPFESINDSFMDVGIHENVEMTNIRYEKTATNEYLAFEFKGADGSKLSHTEWKPKASDTPEKTAERELNQMSRIKKIALNFVTPEQFIFKAHDFESFANKVIQVIGTSYVGVKLRVKVVYSGKYTGLPTYWKFDFIERMDRVPKEKSKIKILSIDKMERPVADPIPSTPNPFLVDQYKNNGGPQMTATKFDESPF